MSFRSDLADELTAIKSRALSLASFAIAVALLLLTIFTMLFPESIPEEEIEIEILITICLTGSIGFFISWYLARRKKLNIAYSLFFSIFYFSILFVFTQKSNILQVQNSLVILLVPVIVATFFLKNRTLFLINIATLGLINIHMYLNQLSPIKILPAYVFFHAGCLASIWISKMRHEVEKRIIETTTRDAKLKEVGYLASSIAHEIANPLSIVTNSISFAQQVLAEEPNNKENQLKVNEFLFLSAKNTKRIATIIDSMFALIRRENKTPIPLNSTKKLLNELIPLKYEFERTYNIKIQFPNDINEVYLEFFESEVIQIISNLIKNACESLSGKEVEDPKIWVDFLEEKEVFKIKICDNGHGLPPQVEMNLGKAFNSGSSKGIGLGLSISLSLAHRNNIKMDYRYQDHHSCFEINFQRFNKLDLLKETKVKQILSLEDSHLIQMSDDLLIIFMRKGKHILTLEKLKKLLEAEFEFMPSIPFHYIVIPNEWELSKEAKQYFNNSKLDNKFLASAMVGNSPYLTRVANLFTGVVNIPYPFKLFSETQQAYNWIEKEKHKKELV